MDTKQSEQSCASFEWEWTKKPVFESKKTFYRKLFESRGVWYDYYDGKVVADVGSGMGRFTWALTQVTQAKKILSVEISPASVAKQRSYIKDPRVEFIQGDMAQVKFRADVIYAAGVIQHTAHPLATLKNLVDNLNEGGEILISFYMTTPATVALRPMRLILSRFPKPLLWALTPLLAPLFMARKEGRESGFKNARHTAYDWFGSHSYQYYFTDFKVRQYFTEAGIHPNNVLCLSKGLYKARKGQFPFTLDDSLMTF